MKKHLNIICILVLISGMASAQVDSLQNQPASNYWTKPRWAPRIGTGAQDRAFFEVGVIRQSLYKGTFLRASKGFYLTTDIFVDQANIILAPRTGMEVTTGALVLATDVAWMIDYNYNKESGLRNAWIITPRVGLNLLGFANVYYGWTIPISKIEIRSLTRNRIGIVFNLNKDCFNIRSAPRRIH